MLLKQSNLPFMFVDNAKQYEDPATIFRSVINVMLFMIKHIKGRKNPEAMGQRVSAAITRVNELQVGYLISTCHVFISIFQCAYPEMRKMYKAQKKP